MPQRHVREDPATATHERALRAARMRGAAVLGICGAGIVLAFTLAISADAPAPSGTAMSALPSGTVAIPEQGGVLRIAISADNAFSPAELTAKAGLPIELTFGPGTGCSQAVKFPSLGIDQDIRAGNTVVKLPPLRSGDYDIYCQSDMDMGTLHVR